MARNLFRRTRGESVVVDCAMLRDERVSYKAKGVYCAVAALAERDSASFSAQELADCAPDGITAVRSALDELERAGYLVRGRARSGDGRLMGAGESVWILLDDPEMRFGAAADLMSAGFELSRATREAAECGKPRSACGKPDDAKVGGTYVGKTYVGKPDFSSDLRKRDVSTLLVKEGKERKENNIISLPSEEQEVVRPPEGGWPAEFEELCEMSVKPVAALTFKLDCLAAWNEAVESGFGPGEIVEAYGAYADKLAARNADKDRPERYGMNLARWLRDKRGLRAWAERPAAPGGGRDRFAEALEAKIARRRRIVVSIARDKLRTDDAVALERAVDSDPEILRLREALASRSAR